MQRVIHREHVNNTLIEIFDDGDLRSLYFGGKILQSSMSREDPTSLILSYTRYMMASLVISEQLTRVLLIGVGAGSLLRFIAHHFPGCRIEGIDKSTSIINLAQRYFSLPQRPGISVLCEDGLSFVNTLAPTANYDLILIDAFDAQGMSTTVYHRDFFEACNAHLHPEGLVSINLWSGDQTRMAEVKTDLHTVFGEIVQLPVPNRGNVICLCGSQQTDWHRFEQGGDNLRRLSASYGIDFAQIARVYRKYNLGLIERLARLFTGLH